MLDHMEVARLLDILGNRNRRRIIELLRQKPCFVTEISDRLILSPKAVIEHLQLMEREEILSFRLDERRRKYYFLANDITVVVSLQRQDAAAPAITDRKMRLRAVLAKLRKMVETREQVAANLRNIDHDIEFQIREIIQTGREIFDDDSEAELVIALAHCDLTSDELLELTGLTEPSLELGLNSLKEKNIIEKEGNTFKLSGMHA